MMISPVTKVAGLIKAARKGQRRDRRDVLMAVGAVVAVGDFLVSAVAKSSGFPRRLQLMAGSFRGTLRLSPSIWTRRRTQ